MKAVAFTNHKDQTQIRETPTPEVSDNEVLVKVKYSALDTSFDTVINKTFVGSFVHKRTDPLWLGWHFSGVVVKMGTNPPQNDTSTSSSFKVGSAVFGHLPYAPDNEQGAIAEYITVPIDACALKPTSIPWDLAAASTTEGLTALQSLRDYGGLKMNSDKDQQSILINGAGGQVGGVAVQIAKLMGAHVTAICSTKDVDRLESQLGADVVIDRRKTSNVSARLKKGQFDMIFDTPNALSSLKSLKYLKPKGTIVMTLPDNWSFVSGFLWTHLFCRKKVVFVEVKSKKADLEVLGRWLEDGLKVDIDSTFQAKDMSKALARNRDAAHKKGRVVVKVENGW
jgi:NADPH:quinone reductase-like Zn-dependent oxidoreductase